MVVTPLPVHSDSYSCRVITTHGELTYEWIDLVTEESGSYMVSVVGEAVLMSEASFVGSYLVCR